MRDLSTSTLFGHYLLTSVPRDPATMAIGTMAASAGSSILGMFNTASGTKTAQEGAQLAGQAQATSLRYRATQLDQEAPNVIGAAQRQAQDALQRARLAGSTLTARTVGGGVAATGATNLDIGGQIAARGRYQALTDLAKGQNTAIGLQAQAAADRYSAAAALQGAGYQAAGIGYAGAGTILGEAGSMFGSFGKLLSPTRMS